jgi:hypothetical protein
MPQNWLAPDHNQALRLSHRCDVCLRVFTADEHNKDKGWEPSADG